MRTWVGIAAAASALVACSPAATVKPIEEVDVESWRADIVAWPSAPNDPDMADLYRVAVADCEASVDDVAKRMVSPSVDPTLVLVGVSYVCPAEQPKVTEAMREMHDRGRTP